MGMIMFTYSQVSTYVLAATTLSTTGAVSLVLFLYAWGLHGSVSNVLISVIYGISVVFVLVSFSTAFVLVWALIDHKTKSPSSYDTE